MPPTLRPTVLAKYKDDTHRCKTMHDDNVGVKLSSLYSNDTEASQKPETMRPAESQPTHHTQSFRDKVVHLRVGKRVEPVQRQDWRQL